MSEVTTRPRIRIEPTRTDRVVDAAASAGLLFVLVITVLYWPTVPLRIPTNFDMAGKVSNWGPKATLAILPASSTFIYVLFSVVSRFPHTFNYPVPITEENAARQYGIALTTLRWIKLEIIWLFAALEWQVIQVSLKKAMGVGVLLTPIALAVIFGTVMVLLIRAYRAR